MALEKIYTEHTNRYCDSCGAYDSKVRIVNLDAGRGGVNICGFCLRGIATLTFTRILYSRSQNWSMREVEMLGWADPAGRSTIPTPENLRNVIYSMDEKIKKQCKGLQRYDVDRDRFAMELRKSLKEIFFNIEEYLKKTSYG